MSAIIPIRGEHATNREWLSPEQVCEIVPGLTVRHLEYLRGERRGPRFSKPTLKTVLYDRRDVDAWIAAHTVNTRDAS